MPNVSTETTSPLRLLIVDDHEVVRAGLRMLLKRWPNIDVVGEAGTAAEGVEQSRNSEPDVVLMDMRLPDGTGVDACREIRASSPQTKVVFLTAFADDDAVMSAIFAGADGYLLKEIAGDALVNAIETVARGHSILDPLVTRAVLDGMRSMSVPGEPARQTSLSPQEQHVLALVAEGKTNKEIAADLGLSYKTVKNYLSNVFQKLQVSHRSQAAALYASRRGAERDNAVRRDGPAR
jgi:DNA-binding NarL/FixJ family response regulator